MTKLSQYLPSRGLEKLRVVCDSILISISPRAFIYDKEITKQVGGKMWYGIVDQI